MRYQLISNLCRKCRLIYTLDELDVEVLLLLAKQNQRLLIRTIRELGQDGLGTCGECILAEDKIDFAKLHDQTVAMLAGC